MDRMTCPRCGSPEAANFTFKILCPEEGCEFYDAKLAEERMAENAAALDWIDELYDADHNDGLDFLAGSGYVLDLSDLDQT